MYYKVLSWNQFGNLLSSQEVFKKPKPSIHSENLSMTAAIECPETREEIKKAGYWSDGIIWEAHNRFDRMVVRS